MDIGAYIAIILLGFIGFLVAFYLSHEKRKHRKPVCPMGGHCDRVIQSEYGKFLGLPVEAIGMAYYAAITVVYAGFILWPGLQTEALGILALAATGGAFVFSMYLVLVQAAAIKYWCTWCIVSAAISTAIFIISIIVGPEQMMDLLAAYQKPILLLHIIGFAIGLGAATASDVFFFKFLKDLRISENEADILHTLTQIIWFGIGLIILSGAGLFAPQAAAYVATPSFLAKMTLVAVIIINGSLLNYLVAPNLVKISFGKKHAHFPGELRFERKLTFALGAVSFTSWYGALTLAIVKPAYSYTVIMLAYLWVLLIAIAVSQMIERRFYIMGAE